MVLLSFLVLLLLLNMYLCLTMVASWLLGKFAKHLSVEPAELLSTSDEAATVGTLAGTGSSKHSLESKKRRSVR